MDMADHRRWGPRLDVPVRMVDRGVRRALTPAALALLLALPAAAQANSAHHADCALHQGEQIRCELRAPLTGQYQQRIYLVARGDGRVSGTAQSWTGECGAPGVPGPSIALRNHAASRSLRGGMIDARRMICVEVVISSCQEEGRAVPCWRGFASASIRVEHRQ